MGKYSVDESLEAWEANAEFWDDYMGDQSNQFHREVVRPKVSTLLKIKEDDFIFDIACGNGNYSAYIAEQGADVVAFDYSEKMIALAQKRQSKYSKKIEFVDATDEQALFSLRRTRPYTKAVSIWQLWILPMLQNYFDVSMNCFLRTASLYLQHSTLAL